MSTINKKHLSSLLSSSLGMTKKDINLIVNSLIEVIKNGIGSGEEVHIKGFGSFYSDGVNRVKLKTKLKLLEEEQILSNKRKSLSLKENQLLML